MMKKTDKNGWPVLKSYDQAHSLRIALPLGGIGTGTVSLGGRGDLRDWEIMNRPSKGFIPEHHVAPCFMLFAKPDNGPPVTRVLEGSVEDVYYEGGSGAVARNHGMPRFRKASFDSAYPFGQVRLSDPDVPLNVQLEAFNPFIPADVDNSSIPAAILRFVLTNPTNRAVTASVCGSLPNFIGQDINKDAPENRPKANRNKFRQGSKAQGIFMYSQGVDKRSSKWGTMALTTTAKGGISYRTSWLNSFWGYTTRDFWEDFSRDGRLSPRTPDKKNDTPVGSLAAKCRIPKHSTRSITFLLTWHFPNRQTWTPKPMGKKDFGTHCAENRVGNYYTTRYRDAWDAAQKTAAKLPELESETIKFVRAFCDSDLPEVVKEAALFNLAHLRTQTCFRTEDGYFFGFEGCNDTEGCCLGSCTHVWNYEQSTAFLFGDLAKSMREVEFLKATDKQGLMNFRVNLPLKRAFEFRWAAADGQMGCFLKVYRDWHLSGDNEMLKKLWPKIRRAMEFCWIKDGWDADKDGVMEGCQHNTMDVEYYGPNPQMGIWYLGALRATEEMALYLHDFEFAHTCRELFERGRKWVDQHLFNGEYYEHLIRPAKKVAPGLRPNMATDAPLDEPVCQLGSGCLVDQLVGQFMAHICGLGYLVDPKNVRTTLKSILKYNFQDFYGHYNHARSFVLNGEQALLMASYPRGRRPKQPFPYYSEVMTGFEYTAAVGMLYEGQTASGLKCIKAIRDRYDGRKRSPFNEAECGHHYARSMAAWASVLALTGFHYSAVDKTLSFLPPRQAGTAKDGVHFWSNGYAWGTCTMKCAKRKVRVNLKVLHGSLTLKTFELTGQARMTLNHTRTIKTGDNVNLVLATSA